ncbi:hypothetical protein KSP40_PGU021038 [Platanthera guangdongensis]|uniref:Uncharacterized protein n=1 Tax=Platanthera guangdongensis TaxID=2320717 RepID=A0ABR2M0P5_9ASPA
MRETKRSHGVRISAVAISKATDGGKSKNEDERAVADDKSQSEDGAKRAVVGGLRLASHRLHRLGTIFISI